jgi:CTD small phosphatase-like protein 2
MTNSKTGEGKLRLRPYLKIFLEEISKIYEIVIFTAGTKDYADPILDIIEKDKKFFSFRLYRQNATWFNENYYKDLNKLGRDIKKIIIVDDKKICMEFQEANGIIIKPFVFNPNNPNDDYILFDLIRILIRIAKEKPDDVRESLKLYREEIYNKVSGF